MAIASYGPLETEDGARRLLIDGVRAAKDHLIARFKGVDDRDAAERLRNLKLYVARDKLPAPADAETFYHADLIGLAAKTGDGHELGTIIGIHNFGAGDRRTRWLYRRADRDAAVHARRGAGGRRGGGLDCGDFPPEGAFRNAPHPPRGSRRSAPSPRKAGRGSRGAKRRAG